KVGMAQSTDGNSWITYPRPTLDPGDDESIESISSAPVAGGLQAWFVQRNLTTNVAQLLTAPVDPTDGKPVGIPEPVAWQAPKDWHLGLPKENIPIMDACADPIGDDPRHVR